MFQELRRQASWHDAPFDFFHYRDKDQAEVDIVIERGALAVAGVEVKAAATVTRTDFRGLRRLKNAAGDRFAGGVLLYDGETCASFGDGLFAVPLRTLWENLSHSQHKKYGSCWRTRCAEGQSPFAGSLRVSLRHKFLPLPG